MITELFAVFGVAGPLAVVVEFGIVIGAIAKGVDVVTSFMGNKR